MSNLAKFEYKLDCLVKFGAKDKATAFEWIIEMENLKSFQDVEEFLINACVLEEDRGWKVIFPDMLLSLHQVMGRKGRRWGIGK